MDIAFVLVLITINVYVSALGLAHLGVTYGLGVCHACQDYVQTYCFEAASFTSQLCLYTDYVVLSIGMIMMCQNSILALLPCWMCQQTAQLLAAHDPRHQAAHDFVICNYRTMHGGV